jgi:MoaA/NifB/PqqE/SkfB family radical SAM enzyme
MTTKTLMAPSYTPSRYLGLLTNRVVELAPLLVRSQTTRQWIVRSIERQIHEQFDAQRRAGNDLPGLIADQEAFALSLLRVAERALTEYRLSKPWLQGLFNTLIRDLFLEKQRRREAAEAFRTQYGYDQPSFLTISPFKGCNLRCVGCYADSGANSQKLEWEIVDRLVTEAETLWGSQFIVISGGEPLAYRSQGKTILDLAAAHPNTFFLMYTNGTLITDEVTQRLSELGNLTPAISLEGWREQTDQRRGHGVFDKVMAAMDRLFQAGVPFGVSLTATRHNAEIILSEEFIDYIFFERHALYGWIFQYMPIGRSFTLDLMPTPQQRLWMWRQSWRLIREKRILLADFWNHGTLVGGCISAGGYGKGGYFYVDWNGNVSPCVFVPYAATNIKDVYARGGNLNDVYREPFFAGIRRWQTSYQHQNLLAPCLIRDHHDVLRRLIKEHEPEPSDENARAALLDPSYAEGLMNYARTYQELADRVWQNTYIEGRAPEFEDILNTQPQVPEVMSTP